MTKRFFELIASTLAQTRADICEFCDGRRLIDQLAESFADRLQIENPRFNRQRFLDAAKAED